MKIRGENINVEVIKKEIEHFKSLNWSFGKWESKPAIRDRSGLISKFVGQEYDSEKWDYIDNGWKHDHCEICSLRMFESNITAEQYGFKNQEDDWICHECFKKIITEDFKDNEFVLKNKYQLKDEKPILIVSPMVDDFKFEITGSSIFGSSRLEEYLDIPRKILDNGEQDYQTFALMLSDNTELELFEENNLYELKSNSL